MFNNWRTDRTLFRVTLLGATLVIMATFLRSEQWELNFFFTSDTLYLPSIFRDIFLDGGRFVDWSLNPAPNFFPDMGVYFMIQALVGDLRWAHYLFPIVQFVLIAILFRAIVHEAGIKGASWGSVLGAQLLILVLLTGWWGGDFGFAFHLLVNSFHGGAFVNALLCTWLLLCAHRRDRSWPWVMLAFVAFAAAMSNKLFWIMFSIPAVVSILVLAIQSPGRRRVLGLGATVALASISGHVSLLLLDQYLPLQIESPYAYLAFERIAFSWGRFIEMLRVYLGGHPMVAATIAIGLAVTITSLVIGFRTSLAWLRSPREARDPVAERRVLAVLLWALFMPAVLLAPVLNGSFDGLDSLRYNFSVFAVAPLVLGLWLACRLGSASSKVALVLLIVIMLPALWACVSAGSTGYQRLSKYKPEVAEQFDQLTAGKGLRNGVANYWMAKRIMHFSDQDVMILAVHPEVGMYVHVNRPQMYLDSVFNFVILHDELPKAYMTELFKQDTGFHSTEHLEVMVTPPWRFDPVMQKPAVRP